MYSTHLACMEQDSLQPKAPTCTLISKYTSSVSHRFCLEWPLLRSWLYTSPSFEQYLFHRPHDKLTIQRNLLPQYARLRLRTTKLRASPPRQTTPLF
jgi:hypothetical protein